MKKNSVAPFSRHQTHLKAGDPAPDFQGTDQYGRLVGRTSFPGKTIILYFYPKDNTPACTATACSLRDAMPELNAGDYVVLGVSADDKKSHQKFAEKYELPFSLIADTSHEIIRAFDVWGQKMLFGRVYDGILRTTFVIGPDGIIQQVIDEVDTKGHAQQILGAGKNN